MSHVTAKLRTLKYMLAALSGHQGVSPDTTVTLTQDVVDATERQLADRDANDRAAGRSALDETSVGFQGLGVRTERRR